MTIQYFCQNEQRKQDISNPDVNPDLSLNGIDYLEVFDDPTGDPALRQRILFVHFLNPLDPLDPAAPTIENVRIEGGEQIQNLVVTDIQFNTRVLTVELDRYGDFSTYILRIVQGPGDASPPAWLDPLLAAVSFSFKVACPSDLDCKQVVECPPASLPEPEINYLAKDYGSFRQLMLDRLSTVIPEWEERNPSDIGIAAVEVLAYAADHLSYYQDAVATEAYLGTVRRRVSARRHARFLDYLMHDGCNARAWVVMQVNGDIDDDYIVPAHTPLLTGGVLSDSVQVRTIVTGPTRIPLPTDVLPEPELALDQFSLFALDSVCLKASAQVHSGHVGANLAVVPEFLDPECTAGWSVVIGVKAHLSDQDSDIYGNRVLIKEDARVNDVFYNELDNQDGTINGDLHTPLDLPLLSDLPSVPTFIPGTEDIVVEEENCIPLIPGSYGQLLLDSKAIVVLCRGGIYNFQSWSIGDNAKVLFSDSVEIRIADRLETGMNVQIRPNEDVPDLELFPRDIVIYVAGNSYIDSVVVPVVVFGEDTRVVATLYAPNGFLQFADRTHGTGTFFGRQLIAGQGAEIRLTYAPEEVEGVEAIRTCITGLSGDVQVFETLHDLTLREDYNEIRFYTWGDDNCCLPKGATRASLNNEDNRLHYLKPGDLLLLEEVRGLNGVEADADINHRHVVRLTAVEFVTDPLYLEALPYVVGCTRLFDMRVVNIEWAQEDALPFPLCLWNVEVPDVVELLPVGVARGNVVLADNGQTICEETLVPEMVPACGRYRPRLQRTGLTFRVPYDDEVAVTEPASGMLVQDPRAALPDAELKADDEIWIPQRDLLNSDRFAAEFVVETENDSRAYLRFGDNILGKRPNVGTTFEATYRIGNGAAGNVGAEVINQIVLPRDEDEEAIESAIVVRNPLPAQGGTDPEAIEQVQLYAPQAFRVQQRAVTTDDYVALAEAYPEVQKAVATQRWTGSWQTIFITVDRKGGLPVDVEFEAALREYLEPFRVTAFDLEIDAPRLVALDIALEVFVDPFYLRSSVKEELLEVFSNDELAGGQLGFFHPDNLTFAEPVYLSQVIAAVMEVPGVSSVEAERFQRLGEPSQGELENGFIPMGRLEIARLDNDPSAPQNGQIDFIMQGGL